MSPQLPIDLRSDTVTRPTPAMRQAMFEAEVGDDMFGEDPSVNALEARSAALFGREAALFVSSGTLANQLAIRIHTRAGDEVIAGRWAHSVLFETGAAAALAGVQVTTVGQEGIFTVDDALPELKGPSLHTSFSRLMMFENTHNKGGGRIFPLEHLQDLVKLARTHGMATHLDGARIFNACAATGIDPRVYGQLPDTLSFCLSKGLGAPVGSVLVGDAEAIARARRYRKMYGGAMRQAGFLAAAGLYALEHHRQRLTEDHLHTRRLAEGLLTMPGVSISRAPETNILLFDLAHPHFDAASLCQALASSGVLMMPFGPQCVRAVLHLDVSAQQVEHALEILARVLSRESP